jgi:hypothetical protein
MQNLTCHYLQFDEIWGFIGKKQKHVQETDDPTKGDVWTFCAIDAETKLVPFSELASAQPTQPTLSLVTLLHV